MIGQKNTKVFWHQSEARTGLTVWNWSVKTLSPGALLRVLDFSPPKIFFARFKLFPVPTNCPWVAEDGRNIAPKRRSLLQMNLLEFNFLVNLNKAVILKVQTIFYKANSEKWQTSKDLLTLDFGISVSILVSLIFTLVPSSPKLIYLERCLTSCLTWLNIFSCTDSLCC